MAFNAQQLLGTANSGGAPSPISSSQMSLAQMFEGYYRPAANGKPGVGPDFNKLTKGQFDSLDPEVQKKIREKYPEAGGGSVMGSLSDAADLGLGGRGFRNGMAAYKALSGTGAAGAATGASVGWGSL